MSKGRLILGAAVLGLASWGADTNASAAEPRPASVAAAPSADFTVSFLGGPDIFPGFFVTPQGETVLNVEARTTVTSNDGGAVTASGFKQATLWYTTNPTFVAAVHSCVSLATQVKLTGNNNRQVQLHFVLPSKHTLTGGKISIPSSITPREFSCNVL
jgi:hypothetical protein